jgi:hypothetical protein
MSSEKIIYIEKEDKKNWYGLKKSGLFSLLQVSIFSAITLFAGLLGENELLLYMSILSFVLLGFPMFHITRAHWSLHKILIWATYATVITVAFIIPK